MRQQSSGFISLNIVDIILGVSEKNAVLLPGSLGFCFMLAFFKTNSFLSLSVFFVLFLHYCFNVGKVLGRNLKVVSMPSLLKNGLNNKKKERFIEGKH